MSELTIDLTSGIPMVDVKLWSRLKGMYRSMLMTIDTGATVTTLSKDVLYLLGYDKPDKTKEKKRVTTASGVEYVDEMTVDKIKLAGFELLDVNVYAHTFPQESFSNGVIGINILSRFDLYLLFSKGIMRLIPITGAVD